MESAGGSEIAASLADATTARDAAIADLERRRRVLDGAPPPPGDLAAARRGSAEAADQLGLAEEAEATATKALVRKRSELENVLRALQSHRDQLADDRQALRDLETKATVDEESSGDADARRQALAEAAAAEKAAEADLAATRQALAALAPEGVEADLARLGRAIDQQGARRREAEDQRLVARNRLSTDGTIDPHADLANALARRQTATERHATEQRHSAAIALLQRLFAEGRDAIYQNLAQPLADRISGYVECLFEPGTEIRVKLTDDGIEGLDLVRPGDPAFGFAALSGGAREQVAALCAWPWRRSWPPGTTVVCRSFSMTPSPTPTLRASRRSSACSTSRRSGDWQVIVLSCTPGDYSGLGAKEIRLG